MTHEYFERKVMEMILDSKEEPFTSLSKQYANASVVERKFTGCGFTTHFNVPDALAIDGMHGNILDVNARFNGSEVLYMFVLFVRNGKINFLDGVTCDEWKYNYDEAILEYAFEGKRKHELTVEIMNRVEIEKKPHL